jgi:hypothetical protein
MTKYLVLVGLMMAGCGGGGGGNNGATQLWIASKNDELHIQLTPIEPNPF